MSEKESSNTTSKTTKGTFVYECPRCEFSIHANVRDAGKRLVCPRCEFDTRIPFPTVRLRGSKPSKPVGLSVSETEQKTKLEKPIIDVSTANSVESDKASTAKGTESPIDEGTRVEPPVSKMSMGSGRVAGPGLHAGAEPSLASSDRRQESNSVQRIGLSFILFVMGLMAGGVGYFGVSMYAVDSRSSHFDSEEVYSALDSYARRLQAAERTLEEIDSLMVTQAQFENASMEDMVQTVKQAIGKQEDALANDKKFILDTLVSLAHFRSANNRGFSATLADTVSSATSASSLRTAELLSELGEMLEALPDDEEAWIYQFSTELNSYLGP